MTLNVKKLYLLITDRVYELYTGNGHRAKRSKRQFTFSLQVAGRLYAKFTKVYSRWNAFMIGYSMHYEGYTIEIKHILSILLLCTSNSLTNDWFCSFILNDCFTKTNYFSLTLHEKNDFYNKYF